MSRHAGRVPAATASRMRFQGIAKTMGMIGGVKAGCGVHKTGAEHFRKNRCCAVLCCAAMGNASKANLPAAGAVVMVCAQEDAADKSVDVPKRLNLTVALHKPLDRTICSAHSWTSQVRPSNTMISRNWSSSINRPNRRLPL